MPHEGTDKWGNALWQDRQILAWPSASQGVPRTCGHHQNLERGKEVFHPASQREQGPDDILISDCQLPELWRVHSCFKLPGMGHFAVVALGNQTLGFSRPNCFLFLFSASSLWLSAAELPSKQMNNIHRCEDPWSPRHWILWNKRSPGGKSCGGDGIYATVPRGPPGPTHSLSY